MKRTPRIRVLLADGPRIRRDLLQRLLMSQVDVEIIGQVSHEYLADLLWLVGARDADVVVLNLDITEERPGFCGRLLCEYPALTIIGVPPSRDQIVVLKNEVREKVLPVESASSLLNAIRDSVAR